MHEKYDHELLKSVTPADSVAAVSPRLGIVGGGQLAKMTALAGLQLGCHVIVLERNPYSPAALLASHSVVGDYDDPDALLELAAAADVVTLENEFVPAARLAVLEERGHHVLPSARCVGMTQDKLLQKQALQRAGLPTPRFASAETLAHATALAREFGYPLLLKARCNGYDGKGNATASSEAELAAAWVRLGGDAGRALFLESFCRFEKELAAIVVRSRTGEQVVYPVVETVQKDHVCHRVIAPATIPDRVAAKAAETALAAVAAVDGVGSFGVEMFLASGEEIVINELAPRVHNSGHYTIEACVCSQFENHVRAVFGWPLGDTRMLAPAAAMVNLLGKRKAIGRAGNMAGALAVKGAHLHLYGKAMSGPGRKMGHVTALGATPEDALALATRAAGAIEFGATA